MKTILQGAFLALLAALPPGVRAQVETFRIDPEHSFANWEIRHVVAITSGTFHDVRGKILLDRSNPAKSAVEASISVFSLNSSHLRRDNHVLSDEYLDARNHPEMRFVSTSLKPTSAERGTVTGQLTLRGVTKPVTLNYQILGVGADPWGGQRAGFRATTRLQRGDFGITRHLPSGPLGAEVEVTLLIEAIKLGPDGNPWNALQEAEEKAKVIAFPMPSQPEMVATPAPATPPAPSPATPSPEPDAVEPANPDAASVPKAPGTGMAPAAPAPNPPSP